MAARDCIDEIIAAAGKDLSDDELDDIVTRLDRVRQNRQATAKLKSLDEELFDEADAFAKEIEEAAQIEKRNALINAKTFTEFMSFAEGVESATGDVQAALRARMVGSNQRFPGARESVDARSQALFGEYLGGLIADLRREDLLLVFNRAKREPAIGLDIARELSELSKAEGNPGISKNSDALKIAKIVDKYRKAAVARENRAGAWIKPLEGYIARQSHDMHAMRRAGYEVWKNTILPRLDGEKTFGDADADDFLRGAYDGLVTGMHLKANGAGETDLGFAFKGPANLAKRISQHRVLHFKSADDWFAYNAEFGKGTVVEALVQEFERASRNTALMEGFGTNPRAMFDRILKALGEKHRGDAKTFDKLTSRTLQNQFDEIDGTTRLPVNPTAAHINQSVRNVQSMAKLGGATLSAISDLGFKAATISRTGGGNLLKVWGDNLSSSLDGLNRGDRRAVAELIGTGLDGMIGDLATRFSASDGIPGAMARLQQKFFKISLLSPWTDAHKRGLGLMFARDLAMGAKRDFAELPQRATLELYGIDAEKWNIARQAVRKEADGREYLMPDAVRDLSDDVFGEKSPREIRRIKDDIATGIQSFYVDLADEAVPTPGARERAFLRQGTRPGTAIGEAVRYIGQFKAFPVTALTRQLGRTMEADTTAQFFGNLLAGKGDILGLVHLMVASTVLGYVAQSAKEAAKGRTPRDPTDPATWNAALLQGGGLGIYGDFMFGEFNRFGRSALSTLAGPTLGTADDVAELWARVRSGEDAAAQSLRVAMSNAPFANLFYTRIAMDYLFLYQIQEQINPGYLRRMERRIKKENKQRFILPPSGEIPRGGGNRVLEGVR